MRDAVKTDFVVLPCDLVCELGGEKLLQAWMVKAASLADLLEEPNLGADYPVASANSEISETASSIKQSSDTSAHSGGLGVWYDTRSGIPTVKSEEKDFVATVPLPKQPASALASSSSQKSKTAASLLPHLERVVTAMPTDSLNDLTEEKSGYPTRHSLLRQHRAVRMRTTHRDAHIYVFPHWVMDFVRENEYMDNIGEDVVGWWAKAAWQRNLPEKLGVSKALKTYGARSGDSDDSSATGPTTDDSDGKSGAAGSGAASTSLGKSGKAPASSDGSAGQQMPPIIAYVHPSGPTAPLIRRVDTSQLLLAVSLQLAKLPSVEETAAAAGLAADSAAALSLASPFAHTKKVAYPEGVKPRTTVTRPDSLVAENVTVEEKVSIKECVIGANCQIHEGAKLHQCLLMEGVVVGKGARLTRCILGKRSEVGAQSVLADCEVQENMLVEPKSKLIRSQCTHLSFPLYPRIVNAVLVAVQYCGHCLVFVSSMGALVYGTCGWRCHIDSSLRVLYYVRLTRRASRVAIATHPDSSHPCFSTSRSKLFATRLPPSCTSIEYPSICRLC